MRARQSKRSIRKRSVRINSQVRGNEFRVLNDKNEQIGILSRDEALASARKAGVDLVEIAPKAMPPVVKIIDINKHLYLLAKKAKNENRGKTEVKEIKLGLYMADHDIDRLVAKVRAFLKKNHQVKLSLWFKGRQLGKKADGRIFINEFINKIQIAKMVSEPTMQGRVMRVILAPEGKKHE